ncbi:malonyl-[acyl-carrier protein] O-methyltransferase [Folsomia candida]|uniref:Malonyl-[acyl-carrier protein] O-methyltransferase n=1 Tax=Folsomia candida TaxID=158441 RepID=A0A226DQ17_FOLCA|nr:malonyl-[acyl-carrier protein] O-methyltransferase [Folsomia candida]OXA47605.1 Malonyl-[acyl-carrier protein] O-methyltransferase [Folsomia candida]
MNITPEAYKKRNSMQFEEGKQLISKIVSHFPTRKFPIILDIGSGSGNLTHLIAQLIPHDTIFGIDNDPGMIDFAVNNNPIPETIRYVCQDISQPWDQLAPELTRLAGQVDLILSNIALHWVTDLDTACKNMETLLKPGGAFYFNIFAKKLISFPREKQFLKQKSVSSQITELECILNRDELRVVFRSELRHNRYQFGAEEFEVLAPIMFKMYYNLINEEEFAKLDKIGQDKKFGTG